MIELGKRVHIVGIGGFGLSAIGRVLLQRGHIVSGSDRSSNAFTAQLAAEGAVVMLGHAADHVGDVDTVIMSSAITSENPEIVEAQQRGIPIYKRQAMLEPLTRDYRTLAVAGTHGKTTTSAMLAHILRETGHDASYIVGGVMANTHDNAHHGTDDLFVIEADEYDDMFHGLTPTTAIVTSLEYDHPDFFLTPQTMTDSFVTFVRRIPEDGTLILCADNDALTLAANLAVRVITYGHDHGDNRVQNLRYVDDLMQFDVVQAGQLLTTASLSVYGQHNALNALAAALAAQTVNVSLESALGALATFRGTGRRFEVRGIVNDIVVIDDYAHHPTAIATTIEAARRRYPQHSLWAVWQPHTFTRTQQLSADYVVSFGQADHVLVTDIFASREAFTEAIHSRDVVVRMQHRDARASGSLQNTADLLLTELVSPAVVLVMSAGDAPQISERVLAGLTALS